MFKKLGGQKCEQHAWSYEYLKKHWICYRHRRLSFREGTATPIPIIFLIWFFVESSDVIELKLLVFVGNAADK